MLSVVFVLQYEAMLLNAELDDYLIDQRLGRLLITAVANDLS